MDQYTVPFGKSREFVKKPSNILRSRFIPVPFMLQAVERVDHELLDSPALYELFCTAQNVFQGRFLVGIEPKEMISDVVEYTVELLAAHVRLFERLSDQLFRNFRIVALDGIIFGRKKERFPVVANRQQNCHHVEHFGLAVRRNACPHSELRHLPTDHLIDLGNAGPVPFRQPMPIHGKNIVITLGKIYISLDRNLLRPLNHFPDRKPTFGNQQLVCVLAPFVGHDQAFFRAQPTHQLIAQLQPRFVEVGGNVEPLDVTEIIDVVVEVR